ncbi:ATP-binding protein [Kordiimonas lipolytica]|uniref:ATP-binding protein n=1 Tax=Kordiimonas lipolytica TaxID=1662421 RepID=A0ABV8UFE7_9PROT|nr:ATP-binding protein [Kordiimonas lipolytica]
MKLKAVILENFRGYRECTPIPLADMTAFIGRNDAGKSTILEALDIFFEGSTKIDQGDANTRGDAGNVKISVVFSSLPDELILDAGAQTTLANEFLLNSEGDLEITKTYDCRKKTVPCRIVATALHPTAKEVSGLLQKTNTDLKKIVKAAGLEGQCQLNNNPSMRQALYEAADDLALGETEVPLKDGGAKDVWESLKKRFPVYALFKSDRASSDQDPEVQNPMKLAIQSALAGLTGQLNDIADQVQAVAEATANRTIDELKKSYPDLELASVLKPVFRDPKWDSVFKLDLESDDQVPLNKRGSGIRRLILLSFFQAEAKRKKEEKARDAASRVPIVYAIEEPETSQHPDSQHRIIEAFKEISRNGDQILLTTHVPGLAGLIDTESLRFIVSRAEQN